MEYVEVRVPNCLIKSDFEVSTRGYDEHKYIKGEHFSRTARNESC